VTDPTHPLFGRRFLVRSISRPPHGSGHVLVAYRDAMQLRIPVASTSLMVNPIPPPGTKWTPDAIREFLSLVQEAETPCRCPKTSGRSSPKP
jgi:hypothetical protein